MHGPQFSPEPAVSENLSGGLLVLVPLLHLLVPVVGSEVGIGTRCTDHVGINRDIQTFEEVGQADTLDHFTCTLVLQCVLSKEVEDNASQLVQLLEVIVGIEFY